MKNKRNHIPARVVLPFGYIVTIKQISDAEMDKMLERDKAGEPCDGYWNVDNRTLYVLKKMLMKRKRYIVAHDMIHAVNDWMHQCMDDEIAVN